MNNVAYDPDGQLNYYPEDNEKVCRKCGKRKFRHLMILKVCLKCLEEQSKILITTI